MKIKIIIYITWLFVIIMLLYPFTMRAETCFNGKDWINFKWQDKYGYNAITDSSMLIDVDVLKIVDENKTYTIKNEFICLGAE